MMYFITHSGKQIDIENFNKDMVCLEDIAHHLTNICRYGGMLPFDMHYSVAQHCIELTSYLRSYSSQGLIGLRVALLHDASEAYIGDIMSPLKAHLAEYREIERTIQNIIYHKYLRSFDMYSSGILECVLELDKRICVNEIEALMPEYKHHFTQKRLDYEIKVIYSKQLIYKSFLYNCAYLGIKD